MLINGLRLLAFFLVFGLSGCTLFDPDIPDGYDSYTKGGQPSASITVSELYTRDVALKVSIESTGDRQLTRLRLCYSETKALPDTTDRTLDVLAQYIPGADLLQTHLVGLEPATEYYCRVFLSNSDHGSYSNSVVFTTKVPSNNYSWIQMNALPTPEIFFHDAFTVNNRAFVISSFDDWNRQEAGAMLEYLPVSDTWVRRADLPWKNRVLPVQMVIGDKAYVGFGDVSERHEDGSTSYYMQTDWWCYDPATDSWERKADIPARTTSLMAAFGVDGKGYILTADDFWNTTPMYVFEYDPVADKWSRKKNFPDRKLQHAASFVIGSKAFVFTGTTNPLPEGGNVEDNRAEFTTYMWEYEVKTDTWHRRSDFKGGGREWMVATTLNGVGYAGFGSKSIAGDYFRDAVDWWAYHPDMDKWEQRSVFEGWYYFFPYFAFAVDNFVYVGTRYDGVWKYIGEESKK